jgi:chromosomal replication initiator protein
VSCIGTHDPVLVKLVDAIAAKVGPQRFRVWFDNSTRLELRNDNLEIAVPDNFIGEWIGQKFAGTIQEAAIEVFGGPLQLRFQVVPELFNGKQSAPSSGQQPGKNANTKPHSNAHANGHANGHTNGHINGHANGHARPVTPPRHIPHAKPTRADEPALPGHSSKQRLRHDLSTYVVGPSNQLAHNAALHVAQYPGSQYNPLFVHGACGLGKTHLLQGLCGKFLEHHKTGRWVYMTGEEFTNEYLSALRNNKVDAFRRKMRELDLLVIDDVHFLAGKKATQEEFLHTFNAIEALGKQVVMASDSHPKEIAEFGESLVNRFVSGMVVRVDPPNFPTRCEILRRLAARNQLELPQEVIEWVARRVTQNVRELEGAATRINAHLRLSGLPASVELAQQALGDLDRAMVAPVRPEAVMSAVAGHFGIEVKELMSGRRHHTVSLARSIAMFLIRKTGKLSFPEIGHRLGKRNHSTVISACRRIEHATQRNDKLAWTGPLGDREEESAELVQRLEEHARSMA